MRQPSPWLIIDSNIILSAALGQKSLGKWQAVRAQRVLAVTTDSLIEVDRVAHHIMSREIARATLKDVLDLLMPIDQADYRGALVIAAQFLRNAPPSRNGSVEDAHILACAWVFNADIWSHDRDFAGTGWPSWSTANLLAALAD
jgi:predicted nucleic acid-binding protein